MSPSRYRPAYRRWLREAPEPPPASAGVPGARRATPHVANGTARGRERHARPQQSWPVIAHRFVSRTVRGAASRSQYQETTMWTSRFAGHVLRAAVAVLLALVLSSPSPAPGQGTAKQPDFIPTGYDDYKDMLDQLGIKKMRKGRDARV